MLKGISLKKGLMFILLLSLASGMLFWNLGNTSFRHLDEAIFVQVSEQMHESGSWTNLSLNGRPFIHKPPLMFGINSLVFSLLGAGEFSARLFSAICGLLTIVLVYIFARKLFSDKAALFSSLILLSTKQFLFERWSRSAEEDSLAVLLCCLALFFFWLGREKRHGYIYLSAVSVGLVFMTKSLLAAFPIAIIVLYEFWAAPRERCPCRVWLNCFLIILAVVLPWHIIQYYVHGNNFLKIYSAEALYFLNPEALRNSAVRAFLGAGNIERIGLAGRMSPFAGASYYIYVIAFGFFPWSVILPLALAYFGGKAFRSSSGQKSPWAYLLCWVVVPLVIFSCFYVKRTWRINLIYPALAIIVGEFLCGLTEERKYPGNYLIGFLMASAFIAGLSWNQYGWPRYTFCPWLEYFLNFSVLPERRFFVFNNPHPAVSVVLVFFCLCFLWLLSRRKNFSGIRKMLIWSLLAFLFFSSLFSSLVLVKNSGYTSEMAVFADKFGRLKRPAADVYVFSDRLFRLDSSVSRAEFPQEGDSWADLLYLKRIKDTRLHFFPESGFPGALNSPEAIANSYLLVEEGMFETVNSYISKTYGLNARICGSAAGLILLDLSGGRE